MLTNVRKKFRKGRKMLTNIREKFSEDVDPAWIQA